MLEVFFDNEKTFSFFSKLLKSEDTKVNCFEILYDLGVNPLIGSDILYKFTALGILEELDSEDLEKGYFRFNIDSPIVLGLCLFDDFIKKEIKNMILDEGEDNEVDKTRKEVISIFREAFETLCSIEEEN